MVVKHLSKSFGGLKAVDDVSFSIEEGHIESVIGPNGSGKTTTVNLITQLEKADRGSINFCGFELCNYPAHYIAQLGIARTFQGGRTFDDLTVLENVLLGLYSQAKSGMLDGILRTPRHRKERRESIRRAYEALNFMELNEFANMVVGSLSFVNRRWVEITRAMVGRPKLLIMDEPAAGLDASEISELVEIMHKMKNEGVTVLLIEHHLPVVMGVSDEVVVLNFGKKIAEGSPKEVTTNKQVIAAYLGEEKNGST